MSEETELEKNIRLNKEKQEKLAKERKEANRKLINDWRLRKDKPNDKK